MARKKTLTSLLRSYRAEIRASGNAAHSQTKRENEVERLQRTQETLWEKYDWPHLRVERYIELQAGQRYYAPPDDIPLDRIEQIEVRYGNDWFTLGDGITAVQYSMWDSDLDIRSWPVERWQIYEDEQIEMWPIPANNYDSVTLDGRLKVTGIRQLSPLVADDDRADLDDRLITLYAASEELQGRSSADAALKLAMAQQRERDLVGNNSKIKSFSLGGPPKMEGKPLHGPPRVHYRTNETS